MFIKRINIPKKYFGLRSAALLILLLLSDHNFGRVLTFLYLCKLARRPNVWLLIFLICLFWLYSWLSLQRWLTWIPLIYIYVYKSLEHPSSGRAEKDSNFALDDMCRLELAVFYHGMVEWFWLVITCWNQNIIPQKIYDIDLKYFDRYWSSFLVY